MDFFPGILQKWAMILFSITMKLWIPTYLKYVNLLKFFVTHILIDAHMIPP